MINTVVGFIKLTFSGPPTYIVSKYNFVVVMFSYIYLPLGLCLNIINNVLNNLYVCPFINVVNTLAPSFFIGSSSFLQETRSFMKAWMSLNFNKIRPLTTE